MKLINIMKNLHHLIDELAGRAYIMESGVSGIWHYEKWSDGTAKCLAYTEISKSGSSTSMMGLSGYVYESGAIRFPFTFTSNPSVNFSGNVGNNNTVIAYSRNGLSDCAVEMINELSGTKTMRISIYVVGFWKQAGGVLRKLIGNAFSERRCVYV